MQRLPRPGTSVAPATIPALLLFFCAVFVLVSPDFLGLLHTQDAGSQLSKGQQILFGLHPGTHVDNSVYGPAVFYLSALAQKLSGGRLLAEILVIFCGYLVGYYLLFRAFASRADASALLVLFGILAVISFPRFHKYHVLLPQAVFLYGLHRADRLGDSLGANARLAAACVVAGLFRIDFGVYAVLAACLFLALRHSASGFVSVCRATGVFLVIGLLLVSPWLLFIATTGNLAEMVRTSYDTGRGVVTGMHKPLPGYQLERSLLDPGNSTFLLWWFFRLTPMVLAVLLVLRLWRRSQARRESMLQALEPNDRYLLVASAFAFLVYYQAGHRQDLSHIKQSLPSALFVLFLGLAISGPRLMAMRPRLRNAWVAGFGVVTLFTGYVLLHPRLTPGAVGSPSEVGAKLGSWSWSHADGIEAGLDSESPRFAQVLARVRQMTEPGDPVLFLPFYPQAYYFAERHFETPHGWWNPGRFHTAGSQQRFIRSMTTTKLVVDDPTYTFDAMSSRNARAYAPEVMRHVYSEYGIVETIGPWVVMGRDPKVWLEHGRFAGELRAIESTSWREVQGSSCARSGRQLTHVNTLPIPAEGAVYSLPATAGLLLRTKECEVSAETSPCEALALADEGALFVATRVDGRPLRLSALRGRELVDTQVAPPGTYRVGRLPCRAVARRGASSAVYDLELTGVSIEVRPTRP